MPGFETIEVLETFKYEEGRVPVEISLDLQCRIKDDESKSRPFVKLKLAVGSRTIYCDVEQAEQIVSGIEAAIPLAKAKIAQLKAEKDAAWEAAKAERDQRRNNRGRKPMSPGKTQREKEKIARGDKKSHAQRKAEKSEKDRELRNKMQGRK
jgi:hypothetical protein